MGVMLFMIYMLVRLWCCVVDFGLFMIDYLVYFGVYMVMHRRCGLGFLLGFGVWSVVLLLCWAFRGSTFLLLEFVFSGVWWFTWMRFCLICCWVCGI